MESFALARDRAYGTRSQPRGPMVCTRSREPMSTARSEVLPRNLVKPGQCSRSCLTGCWRLPKGWSIDRSRVRTLALKLPRFVTCSPRPHSRRSSVAAGSVSAGYRAGRPPFEDDIRLVTDRAPDADAADVLTGFGAVEMVIPTVEHGLEAARPTKQEDAPLPRNFDFHLVHRKGAALAKEVRHSVHASPRPMGCGPIIRGSA